MPKIKKGLNISLDEAKKIVDKIERRWYLVEPRDSVLSDLLLKWLEKNNGQTNEIVLKGGFKYFVRSYRKALQVLLRSWDEMETIDLKSAIETGYIMKTILKVKIGAFDFKIEHKPKYNHLGNGRLEGIGSYSDIWPILTLITDCIPRSNQVLAKKLLKFAEAPFSFTRQDLKEINNKFNNNNFDSMIETHCRYLTGIAFLYTFFEPARRLQVSYNDENALTVVKINDETIHASSMITVLKSIRDGNSAINLEDAFSPESDFVLFTRKSVNQASAVKKRLRKNNIVTNAIFSFFKDGNASYYIEEKKLPAARVIKNVVLNPDSDKEYSSDEEGDAISAESEDAYEDISTKSCGDCRIS